MKTLMKTIMMCLVFLLFVSLADAEVGLTVNGIDAAKQPAEIEGKENLLIAIGGRIEKKVSYSVKAEMGGEIGPIETLSSLEEAPIEQFLFRFNDAESALGIVNLYAADKKMYELILFYDPEKNKTIALGIDYDALCHVSIVEEPEVIEKPLVTAAALEPETGNESVDLATVSSQAVTVSPKTAKKKELRIVPSLHQTSSTMPFFKKQRSALRFDNPRQKPASENYETLTASSSGMYFLPDLAFMTMGSGAVIEVDPNNVPTRWYAGNVYHVSGEVVMPPCAYLEGGVEITRAPNSNLTVDPNFPATFHGTPENPIWIHPDTDTYNYGYYVCGIEIAGVSGYIDIGFVRIEGATYGIVAAGCEFDDESILDHLILKNNVYGFYSYKNKDIELTNILCYESYDAGVYAVVDEDCDFTIKNSTLDYTVWDGLSIEGPTTLTNHVVTIINTATSRSGRDIGQGRNSEAFGIYLYGYLYLNIAAAGYHDNPNDHYQSMPQQLPVYEPNFPYESDGSEFGTHYLAETSAFQEGGIGYISEFPQSMFCTTSISNTPIEGALPIGYTYPLPPAFENAGIDLDTSSDIDNDGNVNMSDFEWISRYWLTNLDPNSFNPNSIDPNDIDPHSCDLDGNNVIDINDLLMLSDDWCLAGVGKPSLDYVSSSGTSAISGDTIFILPEASPEDYDYFLFRDGRLLDKFRFRELEDVTYEVMNGQHGYRAVAISYGGIETIVSKTKSYEISNLVEGLTIDEYYKPDSPVSVSGFLSEPNTLRLSITNQAETEVYSQMIINQCFAFSIDPNLLTAEPFYDLPGLKNHFCTINIEPYHEGGMAPLGSTGSSYSKEIVREFDRKKYSGTKSLVLAPVRSVYKRRKDVINAYCRASINKNLGVPTLLYKGTPKDWEMVISDPNLRSVLWETHGSYEFKGVRRTVIEGPKGTSWFSAIVSKDNVSGTLLPGDREKTGYSVYSYRRNITVPYFYVFAQSCYSFRGPMPDSYYNVGDTELDRPEDMPDFTPELHFKGGDMARVWGVEWTIPQIRTVYVGLWGKSSASYLDLSGDDNFFEYFFDRIGASGSSSASIGVGLQEACLGTTRGDKIYPQTCVYGAINADYHN